MEIDLIKFQKKIIFQNNIRNSHIVWIIDWISIMAQQDYRDLLDQENSNKLVQFYIYV